MGNYLAQVPRIDAARVKPRFNSAMGRDSIVDEVEIAGQILVQKGYSPENNPEHSRRYRAVAEDPYLGLNPSVGDRIHAFHKETAILAIARSLPVRDQFAPNLEGIYASDRRFFMTPIREETYRDYFVRGNGYREKTRELVDVLVRLHGVFHRHFDTLYQEVRVGKDHSSGLKPRTKRDEYDRWLRYFKTIIYKMSDGFAHFSPPSKRSRDKKIIKEMLRRYVRDCGINLEEAVHEFIDRDWGMSFGDEFRSAEHLVSPKDSSSLQLRRLRTLHEQGLVTIIEGDFKPQNVFRVREGVKVCDFPEMHVDRRTVDLIGAIYNIYNTPRTKEGEVAAVELISRYVDGVYEEEGIQLDTRKLTIQALEARLKYGGVGLFAIDCKYIIPEIKAYVQGWQRFEDVDDNALQDRFLEEMFVGRFKWFANYFLRGHGAEAFLDYPGIEDLRKQVRLVQTIFRKTGILPDESPSDTALDERLARAAAPRDDEDS